jgi:glycosyltransferase involved in cell wall biosynthesis
VKLRVLHTESSTGWGGQEIRILTEARGMLDRGHEVTLVTPAEAQIAPVAEARGIPTVRLPIARKNAKGLAAMRLWLGRNARRFDLINTHSSTDSWLVALSRLSIWRAPPIVRTRHVSTAVNNHLPTRWLYQAATRHIVTTGEALRQQLHRDNRYDLSRMTSVRTGIDLNRFHPRDRAAARTQAGLLERPTLGILATLRDWKGHVQLLEAWNTLRGDFPDWQLLIVGDGPQRDNLEALAARLSLGETIRFVGNQDDAPLWLCCMDVFCLPSFGDEGVPQGLMQAMACGVPAVSTPIGAIAEALQDGVTGFMTPPRDAGALARTLRRLLADAALRERFSAASVDYARRNFGIDVMLDAMESVFERAVNRRSR